MKKWIFVTISLILSFVLLRPSAQNTASARSQVVISIQPTQSISISSPFMFIEPKPISEDGKLILEGTVMNSLAIVTNTSSQLRVSLIDSNFRPQDRLKMWMTPFPKSQASKIYLWDGWREAFQEQLATNIPAGSNNTSFVIEYKGQLDKEPIQLQGTLEIFIFSN
jgi:hypothetical protein